MVRFKLEKIFFCMGPPYSGRSEWCRNYERDNANSTIANPLTMARMLKPSEPGLIGEDWYRNFFYNFMEELSHEFEEILIDDMPLDMEFIKALAALGEDYQIKIFDVPQVTCVLRNQVERKQGRSKLMPDDIKSMYKRYKDFSMCDELGLVIEKVDLPTVKETV